MKKSWPVRTNHSIAGMYAVMNREYTPQTNGVIGPDRPWHDDEMDDVKLDVEKED